MKDTTGSTGPRFDRDMHILLSEGSIFIAVDIGALEPTIVLAGPHKASYRLTPQQAERLIEQLWACLARIDREGPHDDR